MSSDFDDRDWDRDDTGARDDGLDAFDDHPWLLSATDLLVTWAPDDAMASAAPDVARRAWDRYFEREVRAGARPSEERPAEKWDSEAAELVVDCLYRFLHAIERCDIADAMECVADEYHVFEHDEEVDRDGLRLRLESSLERWRGSRLAVSLTEIPQLLFHPYGVLTHVTLQIDFWSAEHSRTVSDLLRRVLWFRAQRDGRWLLSGMTATA